MSIVRNSRSVDPTMTIKRFVAGQAYDTIGSTSFKSVEYLQFKGTYLANADKYYHIDKETPIVIKCELASDASGFIFGSPTGLSISVANGTVTWFATGQKHSVTLEEGVHLYGFIYGKVNDTEGFYPFYDGACYGTAVTTTNITTFYVGAMAGSGTLANVSGNPITSSGTWAIRVYEIIGQMKRFTSVSGTGTATNIHLYASTATVSNTTTNCLHDTLSTFNDCNFSSSGTTTAGSAVTYGVQLHDLKDVFKSDYQDLMAIVCEDNPNKAESWADPAEVVSKTGDTYYSAIALKDRITSPYPSVPLPAGYSVQNPSTTPRYLCAIGDLIYGRNPKFNIWNDNNKFGFWVDLSESVPKMFYNIFKDFTGAMPNERRVELSLFDGYNNHSDCYHAPVMTTPSSVRVELHNDMHCQCNATEVMAGDPAKHYDNNNGNDLVHDEHLVFFYKQGASGFVGYRAGNLIPWNYTKAEMQNHIYVWGVCVKAGWGENYEIFNSVDKPNDASQTGGVLEPFSSATPWRKSHYQQGITLHNFQISPGMIRLVIDAWIEGLDEIRAEMGLLAANTNNPSASQIIDCSRFVPMKKTHYSLENNTKINANATNFRLIVHDDDTIKPAIVIGYKGEAPRTAYGFGEGKYDIRTRYQVIDASDPTKFTSRLILPFIQTDAQGEPTLLPAHSGAANNDFTAVLEMSYKYYVIDHWVVRHAIAVIKSRNMAEMLGTGTGGHADLQAFRKTLEYWAREKVSDSYTGRDHFPHCNKFYQRGYDESLNNDQATLLSEWEYVTGSGWSEVGDVVKYTHFFVADYLDFGMNNLIPDDATIFVALYKTSEAPVFCGLRGDWDGHTQTLVCEAGGNALQVPNTYEVSNPSTQSRRVYNGYANLFVPKPGQEQSYHYISTITVNDSTQNPTTVETLKVDFNENGKADATKGAAYGDSGYAVRCTRDPNNTVTVTLSKNGEDLGTVTVSDSTTTEQTASVTSTISISVIGASVLRTNYLRVSSGTQLREIEGLKLRVYATETGTATDYDSNKSYPYNKFDGGDVIELEDNGQGLSGSGDYFNASIIYSSDAVYDGYFKGLDGNVSHTGFCIVQITSGYNLQHGARFAFDLTT